MYSFPLQDDEQILRKTMANLYADDKALNGALYLTNRRLVFVGYVLGFPRKMMEEVPLELIGSLEKRKTFGFIPNILWVHTMRDRHLKFIIHYRECHAWYTALGRGAQQAD